MQPQEQINLYIAEQPDWQRKLLVRMRQLIHGADATVKEAWRGHAPSFEVDGEPIIALHGLKTCASAWFHKGALLKDTHGLFKLTDKDEERLVRKYKVDEGDSLHEKGFTDLVKRAIKQVRQQGEAASGKRSMDMLPDLEDVLTKDDLALERWAAMPPSHKREYIEWIADAAKEETRKRRIAKALEMIREGQAKGDAHKVG